MLSVGVGSSSGSGSSVLPTEIRANSLPSLIRAPRTSSPSLPPLGILKVLLSPGPGAENDVQIALLAADPAFGEICRVEGHGIEEVSLGLFVRKRLHAQRDLVVSTGNLAKGWRVFGRFADLGHVGFDRVVKWDADVIGGRLWVVGMKVFVDTDGVLELYGREIPHQAMDDLR